MNKRKVETTGTINGLKCSIHAIEWEDSYIPLRKISGTAVITEEEWNSNIDETRHLLDCVSYLKYKVNDKNEKAPVEVIGIQNSSGVFTCEFASDPRDIRSKGNAAIGEMWLD